MKNKIKSIFLSLIMVCSVVTLAACKDDNDSSKPSKKSPTVNVVVEDREFYVGETLSTILILLSEGDTTGTIAWAEPDTLLVFGENECDWVFTPESTSKYKTKTGTAKINAVVQKQDPIVNAKVTSNKVYAETKLSTVSISLSEGDTTGTLEWINPDTVLTEGTSEHYARFTPTETETFKQKSVKISVTAVAQKLVSISVKTAQTKTNYKAFETFDDKGLVLLATYDGGKTEEITTGWTISYPTGNSLLAGDNTVSIIYQGKLCKADVSVAKIEIAKPQIQGTYVYTGASITAVLKPDVNSSLYTVSNNVYTLADTHNVTVTLKDSGNYKWVGTNAESVTIPFVIEKAELVVQKNNYTGTYDNKPHFADVVALSSTVYYSLSEIDASNYEDCSTEPISFTNAGLTKVYFFVKGDRNHNDMSSFVTVEIKKANAVVTTEYAYSVAGQSANVPLDYVSVKGVDNVVLETENMITFEYFTSYADAENNAKTSTANGATVAGGAPSVAGRYVVVATYKESANYTASTGISILLVDNDDCPVLAHEERKFAWRETNMAQSEVYAYVEVNKKYEGELNELVVTSKIEGVVADGKVIKLDGIYKLIIGETTYNLDFAQDGNTVAVKTQENSTFKTLTKWVIPNIFGTFECDTVTSDTTTPNSSMVISCEYGEMSFVFTYYYGTSSITSGTRSGYVTFVGSKISFYTVNGNSVSLLESISNVDDSTPIESLTLNQPLNPPAIWGTYVKVA